VSRHRIVNPPELGVPSGFSHAVVAEGKTVHLAGQIGAGATLAEQFDSAADRLVLALRAAGGEPEDLVSLQVFVTDVAAYKQARVAIPLRPALPGHGPVRGQ
jgi:enamine deaminase RidA (YjgF/YER057c/UK114 family)